MVHRPAWHAIIKIAHLVRSLPTELQEKQIPRNKITSELVTSGLDGRRPLQPARRAARALSSIAGFAVGCTVHTEAGRGARRRPRAGTALAVRASRAMATSVRAGPATQIPGPGQARAR